MAVVRLLVGFVLLTLGRKLFWLFVAGAGFVATIFLVTNFVDLQPEWLVIAVALGAGILGALLAVFLQRVAVGIAGFIIAGYSTVALLQLIGLGTGRLAWVPFIIGGVVGAILMAVLFEWALIALSSLSGATLVAEAFPLNRPLTILIFVGALLLGIGVQAGMLAAERRREARAERAEAEGE